MHCWLQLMNCFLGNDTRYCEAVESFLRQWFHGSNASVHYTPLGLAMVSDDGGIVDAGKVTF